MSASEKVLLGVIGAGAVAGVFLVGRRAKAAAHFIARKGIGAGMRISENFTTTEFLKSNVAPDLINYQIPPNHFANLKILVDEILQPARDKFGAIRIQGGYRPQNGFDWYKLLTGAGYTPAKRYSDHFHAGAADAMPTKLESILPYWEWLKIHPVVRQVILYRRTLPDGGNQIYNIHVSAVVSGYPRFSKPSKHHFIFQDGEAIAA